MSENNDILDNDENVTDPAVLVQKILLEMINETPRLAKQTHELLMPISNFRTNLRETLQKTGEILNYDHIHAKPTTIAAADGARLQNEKYAVDELWAVAVSSNGLTSTENLNLECAHWGTIVPHDSSNGTLAGTAMAILELNVIGRLEHKLRILDGSFQTPYITLIKSLNSPIIIERLPQIKDLYVDNIDYIRYVSNPDAWGDSTIVALPKADSSKEYFNRYRSYMTDIPQIAPNDKFLASQILSPGEMLFPRHAEEIARLGLGMNYDEESEEFIEEIGSKIIEGLSPLRTKASITNRQVGVFYFKPLTSDTVIKVEYVAPEAIPTVQLDPQAESPALLEAKRLAKLLSDETPGPYIQEPFAQYNVDLIAKQISPGASAVSEAMVAHLPQEAEPYIQFLNMNYRT